MNSTKIDYAIQRKNSGITLMEKGKASWRKEL